MVIFIDANIYISLLWTFDLIDDYIDKILEKVNKGDVRILLPLTTQSEVKREIENKIEENSKRTLKIDFKSPEKWFKDELELFNKKLEEKLKEDKDDFHKKADNLQKRLVKELVPKTLTPEETPTLMNLAYSRKGKGYPPGKPSDRIGDQLAWEIILDQFTNDDVVIISQDSDWYNYDSTEDNLKLNYLLENEYKERSKKGKKIKLYKSIGDFIEKAFPEPKSSKGEHKEIKKPVSSSANIGTWIFPSNVFADSNEYVTSLSVPINLNNLNIGSVMGTPPASGASISVMTPSGSLSQSFANLACKNCGYPISLIANFCSNCGAKRN